MYPLFFPQCLPEFLIVVFVSWRGLSEKFYAAHCIKYKICCARRMGAVLSTETEQLWEGAWKSGRTPSNRTSYNNDEDSYYPAVVVHVSRERAYQVLSAPSQLSSTPFRWLFKPGLRASSRHCCLFMATLTPIRHISMHMQKIYATMFIPTESPKDGESKRFKRLKVWKPCFEVFSFYSLLPW